MASKSGRRALAPSVPRSQPDIADRRLQALYAYWEKERGDRALPSRTDIDPAALRFLLGHLILVDVLRDPLQFRVRLQGTEVEWWMGGDLTGKALDQLQSPALRALALECLKTAVERAAPFCKLGEETVGDLPRRYEALLLPLANDGASVNMVLAAVLCRDDRERP